MRRQNRHHHVVENKTWLTVVVVRDAGAAGLLVSAVREEQRLRRGVLMGDLIRPAAPQTAVEHVHDARAGLGVGLVDVAAVLRIDLHTDRAYKIEDERDVDGHGEKVVGCEKRGKPLRK